MPMTTNNIEPLPHRCQRCGCHRPANPDNPLALCTFHWNQCITGTIGKDFDPMKREAPVKEAHALLDLITELLFPDADHVPVRKLAAASGLTKDLCHHVRSETWSNVRSAAWLSMLEALGNILFEQRRSNEARTNDEAKHSTKVSTKAKRSATQQRTAA